ncbi:N-acetylglucosamine kinase [Microbispora sp. ATCC PTA-5024]|uniref:N-acetylglucosamine kinase n=1 Tax=Microbispora sp. ATCC PTA-5024 TaxID=316330 RepID=UPI0003DD5E5C|nr:BadF/BadG/BcrA/BcrD ATPase family protein [Microbispora sp. ATCC PTA-5024]ETK31725.1 ATPase [Microbispora sp. ATCC PTA-5024]
MSGVLVGLDIGGTKTAIRAETPEGTLAWEAVEPSGDWSAGPVAAAARWIEALVGRHTPAGQTVLAVGAGAQGCDTEQHCRDLADALRARLGVPCAVTNDAALLVSAAGLEEGIGVIAGTGSIAVAVGRDGGLSFAGGWGWVIGDEGSAAGLVREAVKVALARDDAGGAPDVLLPLLMDGFQVTAPAALARAVNDNPAAGYWADRAPVVFEAARRGSADATEVIETGGRRLAGLVGTLVSRGAVATEVVTGGSVFVRQPMLFHAFQDALAERHPRLPIRLMRKPPVRGAVVLARRALDRLVPVPGDEPSP